MPAQRSDPIQIRVQALHRRAEVREAASASGGPENRSNVIWRSMSNGDASTNSCCKSVRPMTPVYQSISASAVYQQHWQNVAEQCDSEANDAARLVLELALHQLVHPNHIEDVDDLDQPIAEIRQRFAEGKQLPRIGGAAMKKFVAASQVNGKPPSTIHELDLITAARTLERHRRSDHYYWCRRRPACP
jgi:hypothetical protein